ncbi:hypothetical protein CLIB1423_06S04148 [[Candida] railenensis]|uniref:Shikimate dehydrogenase substrate binding N-terminal domain-containing protein n=1 Tax=[Candida] railenensis TaxID=45579 RepID=A0A9P0QN75_9ASCO|nr:hypothetical protein CLIB1423_06S04148 [[Candida] railenensis]
MSNCIFLIGVRGCGKSTLGLMASVLLDYTYIDLEQCVLSETGMPDNIYLQSHTIDEYQKLQFELIYKSIAEIRQRSAEPEPGKKTHFNVFVLPAVFIENPALVEYFLEEDYPYVIHIEREEIKILEYLEYNDSFEAGTKIIRQKYSKYRTFSKYAFFNLHSDSADAEYGSITPKRYRMALKTISLKATERDFIHFLFNILGIKATGHVTSSSHLTNLTNKYSTAIQMDYPNVHLQDILYNLNDAIAGADTIEIKVDLVALIKLGLDDMETYLNRFVETLRRYSFGRHTILSMKNSLSELNEFLIEYSSTIGMSYESQDLSIFYLSFLNIAKRLGIKFVVLDLELVFPSLLNDNDTAFSTPVNSSDHNRNDKNVASSVTNNNHNDSLKNVDIDNKRDNSRIAPYRSSSIRTTNNINDIIITNDNTNENRVLVKEFLDNMGGCTIVIGKYHSENNSSFWDSHLGGLQIMEYANEVGIPMARLTTNATSIPDNLKCWNFTQYMNTEYPSILLTAFNTGELGKLSKILNRVLTPVHTDLSGASGSGSENAENLRNYDVQRSLHRAFFVPSYNFYVVGSNVSHIMLPAIHNGVYNRLGLPHKCSTFECTNILSLKNLIESPNFGGATIHDPFTEDVFNYVDEVSEHARKIGSVNLVLAERLFLNPAKVVKTVGYNTDWLTITVIAKGALSPVNCAAKTRTALIFGAGGVSRASIYAMILFGYEKIMIFHKDYSLAAHVAEHFNKQSPFNIGNHAEYRHFEIVPITENDLFLGTLPNGYQYPNMIINGDPMIDPKSGELFSIDLPIVWFSSETGGVVLETTYDPIETPLIYTSGVLFDRGWLPANGLNYVLSESCLEFEFFVNKPAPRSYFKSMTLGVYNSTRSYVQHDLN